MKICNSFAIIALAHAQHTRLVEIKPSDSSLAELKGNYDDGQYLKWHNEKFCSGNKVQLERVSEKTFALENVSFMNFGS